MLLHRHFSPLSGLLEGVFAELGANALLDAYDDLATHAGLLQADAGKSFTGVASTDVCTSTAHGYANGNLVMVSALTGGSGLVVGRPYFVIAQATNTFQLAATPGGSAVDLGSDVSAGTVTRLVELTGGSPAYARQAIAFNAAAGRSMPQTSNISFDVPACTVHYAGYYSASTAGSLYSIDDVLAEVFAAQGTYTLTGSTHSIPT